MLRDINKCAVIKHTIRTTAFYVCCFLTINVAYASAMDQQLSTNVYDFQLTLAKTGNPQSQTKVGQMLEAGNGVPQDIKQAQHWYQLAAKSGYVPAENRLKFLEMKIHGYNKSKDAAWVNNIIVTAHQRNRDAMLLLAQMYRQGIGVDKNYVIARKILNILNASGGMIIDFENSQLNAAIRSEHKRQQAHATQRAAQEQQHAKASQQAKEKQQQVADSKQESEAEKRKRYEAAMKQHREQQRLIDAQQKWAEGT